MNNQNISEEERHEAATEEAATVGCPSLGIPKLPSGFDGVEPSKPVSEEARQKVEQAVVRQRQKLTQIAEIALAAEAKSNREHVKLGSKYLENAKALCTIRNIVGPGLTFTSDGKYYTPGWLADLAKAIEAEAAKRPCDESTRKVLEHLREDSPDSPDSRSEAEIQREEARQKRKIHWTCYPTKVDLCVMGKTEQNGNVYEVRVNKRKVADVQDTYGQCKVNGKTFLTVSFTGGAWMLKRILTQGMQSLVNYKAKKRRDSRRNYKLRDAAAKAAGEVK